MVTPVTVTFSLLPPGNGRVTCQLSGRMSGAGQTVETVPIVASLEAGQGKVRLWATDDPGTLPQGRSWTITITMGGIAVRQRQVVISAAQGPTVDYGALADAAPVGPPVQIVVGTPGPAAWSLPIPWTPATVGVVGPPSTVVTRFGGTYVCVAAAAARVDPASDAGVHWAAIVPISVGFNPTITPGVGSGGPTISIPNPQWALDPTGAIYYLNGNPVSSGWTAATLGPDLRIYPIGVPA